MYQRYFFKLLIYTISVFQNLISTLFLKVHLQSLRKSAGQYLLLEARLPACIGFQGLSSGKHLETNHLQVPVCKQMYMGRTATLYAIRTAGRRSK